MRDPSSPLKRAGMLLLLFLEAVFSFDTQCVIDLVGDQVQRLAQRFVFLYQFFFSHTVHLLYQPKFRDELIGFIMPLMKSQQGREVTWSS